MAGKIPEIPFSYGEVVGVTGVMEGLYTIWFRDYSGVIRGVPIDGTNPAGVKVNFKDEIIIKRATEGQARRKKGQGTLPPVGASSGDTSSIEKK